MAGDSPGARRLQILGSLAANRTLMRVVGAYTLFLITEYAMWLGMLIYAYRHGGVTLAGVIAVAQLLPGVVLAPFAAGVADRWSPVVLLAGGYIAQAVGMGAAAGAVVAGVPAAAYVAAVFSVTASTAIRPAQATLIPSLASTAHQLTAANVVLSWAESVTAAVSGLLTGVLIAAGGVGLVFAVSAGLTATGTVLVFQLRVPALGASPERAPEVLGDLLESLRLTVRRPHLRLMVGLLTASAVVLSALDLLIVILAISVLHRTESWAGYLSFACGIGAVLAAPLTVMLVGRRLSRPILTAALLLSAALAALAFGPALAGTLALLAVAGASDAMLETATRTLLQRSVPAHLLGRVFGVLEGMTQAGYALGALLVPALVALGGTKLALLAVAAVLPLAAIIGGRGLFSLDAEAPVPVVEIALLRSLPLFSELPAPSIEGLAAALTPVEVPAGDVLIRQGDPGDAYYAIASGELDAEQDGHFLRRCVRGDGVGEIALLRSIPRTATIIAHTAATVFRLDREPFLTTVLGHALTRQHAASIAEARLAADATPSATAGTEGETDDLS